MEVTVESMVPSIPEMSDEAKGRMDEVYQRFMAAKKRAATSATAPSNATMAQASKPTKGKKRKRVLTTSKDSRNRRTKNFFGRRAQS